MALPETKNPVPEDDDGRTALEDEFIDEVEEDAEMEAPGRRKMQNLLNLMSGDPVPIRVHDVVIQGNVKTKSSLIETEMWEVFGSVTTMQELVQAAAMANVKLRQFDIFETVSITLDAGPMELPDTANIFVKVVEESVPVSGEFGVYTKPGDSKSQSVELSMKFKNLFGIADIWDISGVCGWNQITEISTGVYLPRFKSLPTPVTARVTLHTQDWLKFSSYKENMLGLNVSLFSKGYHDLAYNLIWRNLSDPSHISSKSIRRHLGHTMHSSLKYTFKIDRRNSHIRPTGGYAFLSASQIGGFGDSRFSRFIRQEFDLQGAASLGFRNTALNFGISAGIILPWGREFMSASSPISDRFYIGGQSSLVGGLDGPLSLSGFKPRGLGPTDFKRQFPRNSGDGDSDFSPETDALGGDLAVTSFSDISFDLPFKLLRESGIYGHTFICAGNLVKLTENEYKRFSFQDFLSSFRCSVGAGIVIPTKIFCIEINYCYILKKFGHDHGKTGIQFSFSSPS